MGSLPCLFPTRGAGSIVPVGCWSSGWEMLPHVLGPGQQQILRVAALWQHLLTFVVDRLYKRLGLYVGCLWPGSCQVRQDSRILSLAFFKGEVLASCGMMSLRSIWFELIN